MTRPLIPSVRPGEPAGAVGAATLPGAPRLSPTPTPTPARPAAVRSLRLTSRGRVAVLVAVCLVVLAAFSVGRLTSTASGAQGAGVRHVVVHGGDTLWTIARAAAPHQDPRVTVDWIQQANHLESSAVRVGQDLVVPRG